MFTTTPFAIDTFKFSREDFRDVPDEFTNFCETLHRGEIPTAIPRMSNPTPETYIPYMKVNETLRHLGYWGAATKIFAQEIRKKLNNDVRILDPFAGVGWMVKSLREEGLRIHGTDSHNWITSQSIEQLDAINSIRKYGRNATHILLSWVPYDDPIDVSVVREARKINPAVEFLYIGESRGGCTGSEGFWDLIEVSHMFKNYESATVLRHDFACLLK